MRAIRVISAVLLGLMFSSVCFASIELNGAANVSSYTQTMLQSQLKWLEQNRSAKKSKRFKARAFEKYWCAPGVDCQDRMVIVHVSDSICSGVLVAKDVVLTNRHCTDLVVKSPFESFTGSFAIEVPSVKGKKGGRKVAFGKDLIAVSPLNFYSAEMFNPDYAFVRLDREVTDVTPAAMNFEGLKDGETYFIYGVSPYSDGDRNAIERRGCVARYNTTFAAHWQRPKDAVIVFADCPIGPSNSGSPIFNGAGELVGLIGGQVKPGTANVLGAMSIELGVSKQNLTSLGWGTNLACMPDIRDLSKPIDSDCDIAFASNILLAEIPAMDSERVSAEVKTDSDGVYEFQVQRANLTHTIFGLVSQAMHVAVPRCIYADSLARMNGKKRVTQVRYSALQLNSYYEMTSTTSGPRETPGSFLFDIKTLRRTGAAPLTVEILDGIQIFESTLKICEERRAGA